MASPARVRGNESPKDYAMPYEEITFQSRDKLNLSGWHIPADSSKATIIMAHGYSGSKASDLRHARWLWEGGYNLFMVDFRGHGRSDGPSGTSIGYIERLDIHAAVDYLLGQGEARLALFGISMGASAGIIAAGENPHICAVIADSPYSHLYRSISTEIRRIYRLPDSLANPLAKFAFKALADYHGFDDSFSHPANYVHRISPRPLLLIHGEADSLTRVENSQILYSIAGEPKSLWVVPGIEHSQVFDYHQVEYKKRVLEFLNGVNWITATKEADPSRWKDLNPVTTLDGLKF